MQRILRGIFMNSTELLVYCKYYKGEQSNPFITDWDRTLLWECERYWTHAGEKNQVEVLKSYLQELMSAGMVILTIEDEVPITLKAVLYHNFCLHHGLLHAEGGAAFKTFYQNFY